MMDPRTVIIRPLVTEKSLYHAENYRVYRFEVDRRANKVAIKDAIQAIYDVKVEKVRVMNMKGKARRVRMSKGVTRSWKKALVTISEGQVIEII